MKTPATIRQLLSACKVHGSGASKILISDSEVYALICISAADLQWDLADLGISGIELPEVDYYKIPFEWFSSLDVPEATPKVLLKFLESACKIHDDYRLYIQNLCELHRRRSKYQRILSTQPAAQIEQIVPRALLEYGVCNTEVLFSWMIWRKWIYDIDNRSAQETGYLFEPILASCLGGESIGAKKSPVKRLDDNGNFTTKGRQVDCFVADENRIYEFKLRVTIAASGQGRFTEELSFPKECQAAGFTPALLVLDPTPSSRLDELENAFIDAGGFSYKGEDAWKFMEQEAGEIMSVFIDKYIKPPIENMESINQTMPEDLSLCWTEEKISIVGTTNSYEINRKPDEIEEMEEENIEEG